jgi:hypothetical protein
LSQNIDCRFIAPAVGFKSKSVICLYRIKSFVLQVICLQFVDQSDASTFLS